MQPKQPIVSGPNAGGMNTDGMPGTGNMPGMQPGQPYTAAFSQPITSPGPQDMSQPMQPMQMAQPIPNSPVGQPVQSVPGQNVEQNPLTGAPMIMQSPVPEAPKKDLKSLIKTIAIIALSLVSMTFIGLFIWMYVQYNDARTDVDGQIADAVVKAVDENTTKLEGEFAEREKYPFRTFAGPADYGELAFEYPKTWSVYVASDARNGGDFEAYFNPVEVNEVSNDEIAALRVKILDTAFDEVARKYQSELEGDDAKLRVESVTIGQNNDISASRYTGILPDTEFNGYVVLFKIRDKTVVMQSDSVLFEGDYNTLLSTVRFNS